MAPRWAAAAGFGLLVATVLFLMALVVAEVSGRGVPCSGRGLIVFIIALTTGSAAGFLTGSATAEGKIPFFGGNVMHVAASGALAAIVIVTLVGFRSYASSAVCDTGELTSTAREQAIADRFWRAQYSADWRTAYDLFPDALRQQTSFAEFVKSSAAYLSQFSRPPRRRQFERADQNAGTLMISTLAEFDGLSTVREFVSFSRQKGAWVPWSYVINPVEWPVANTYTFVTQRASEIIQVVENADPEDRARLATERYQGKYVGPPGWQLVVEAIGNKNGDRTCDLSAREETSDVQFTLHNVLDGCALPAGARIQCIGRIQTVADRIHLEAIRFWR